MGSRIQSHQLSGGLYVSGRPDSQNPVTRPPSLSSRAAAVVYTGGDVSLSGDLAKMFEIPTSSVPKPISAHTRPNSGPIGPNSAHTQFNSGQIGPNQFNSGHTQFNSGHTQFNSGQIGPNQFNSGHTQFNSGHTQFNSGQIGPNQFNSGHTQFNSGHKRPNSGQIGPTGLITSGRRSVQLDPTGPIGKTLYGPAVTELREGERSRDAGVRVSRGAVWAVAGAGAVAVMLAVFLAVAAARKKAEMLAAVVAAMVAVAVVVGVVMWNFGWKKRGVLGYWKKFADAELRGAVDGQYVKVTGVVTCGSIPLETSFQRVPRCVYASTELYEYRGWGGKSANPKHRFFSWGCRQAEKYVADFYISDFQSGLRALVKSGYGAKVSVFVEPTTVVDITKDNRDSSPSFLRWLSDRSLSSDDRIMRLKEGYIKEGSTVSVLGKVRRHDNVLMIVPPTESVSTRCQWFRCLFPTYSEGLILLCDESQTDDVIAV